LVGFVVLAGLGVAPALLKAEDARKFVLPKDRAAWQAQRESIRETVWKALGDLPPRPRAPKLELSPFEGRDGVKVATFRIDDGTATPLRGVLAVPAGFGGSERLPALLYLANGDPMEPGPLGTPTPVGLARSGFAVLCRDVRSTETRRGRPAPPTSPWVESDPDPDAATAAAGREPSTWGLVLRDDLVCLDALLERPEIDPKRVGVGGAGLGGTRAWWLLALDERIACGASAGGLTRLGDWQNAQGLSDAAMAPWVRKLRAQFDAEAIIALCAPRALEIMVGTRDPSSPLSGVLVLRDMAKRAYRLVQPSGVLMESVFGGLGPEFTLLEWDSMLELFDKALKPQGPTPLRHEPEPEPVVDGRFVDPAAHGLAGWVPEMSQRPNTWRWEDGTIVCDPGKNEYGWLRAPIEVEDFILSLEWKVPKKGNTGIFLRARPVDWFIPPRENSEEGKWEVATRGLEWPSRTGLELQATDDAGHADKYSSGSLYRHAAPAENVTRPAGEWNRYTVRFRGTRVEVWCNGRQVLDTRIDQYPTLRHPPLRGYFGLQNHGVAAQFRNIRYLRLNPASATEAATSD
jgi:hypothetical protein